MLRTPNQLLHWRCQNSATCPDASGNNNTATLHGVTQTTGVFGNAFSFDGTDDTVLGDTNINLGQGDFTVCAWITPAATGVAKQIINCNYNNNNAFCLDTTADDRYNLITDVTSGADSTCQSVASVVTTNATHIAFVRSNDCDAIYMNGNRVPIAYLASDVKVTMTLNYAIELGYATAKASAGTYFAGTISEVMVYNTILSSNDIKRVMMGMHPLMKYSVPYFLEIKTTSSNETFTLPIVGGGAGFTQNFTANWGDGTTNTVVTAYNSNVTHTYAVAGTYKINMVGTCEWLSFNNGGDKTKVIGVNTPYTDLGFKYLDFYGCTNLISVKSLGTMSSLINATSMFRTCTSLTTVPSDLFYACPNILNFAVTFGDSGLITIPAYIFDYNVLVSEGAFNSTFANCPITSIPNNIFDFNVNAGNNGFNATFYGTNITSTGSNIFDYATLISTNSFGSCYGACTSLETASSALFEYNVNAISFSYTFNGCNKIQLVSDLFSASINKSTRFLNKNPVFTNCFTRTTFTGTQGAVPDIWNYNFGTGTPSVGNYCGGAGNSATSLSNYADIPPFYLTLSVTPVTPFSIRDVITGQSSGVTSTVMGAYPFASGTKYFISNPTGNYTIETVGVTGDANKLAAQTIAPTKTACFL